MNCEAVRDNLTLLLYEELQPAERSTVEDHLEACEDCRNVWERERRLFDVFDSRHLEPPPGLLAECRSRFQEEVQSRGLLGRRDPWWKPVAALWQAPWMQMALKPVAALGLIAVGFVGARLAPPSLPFAASSPALFESVNTSASLPYRIRQIQRTPDGQVTVSLEETREVKLSGRIEDEQIQRALLAAYSSPDPALRQDSVDMLQLKRDSPVTKGVLVRALTSDPSPGVRLKALEALTPFAGDESMRAVLAKVVLGDDNPGVRVKAIDLLVEHKEYSIAGLLQDVLEREENAYVRSRCQTALIDMNASAESF